MKNRIRLVALLCVLALLLSGCGNMFNKEYRSEEPYKDDYIEVKDDSSVQEVKNYRSMKIALMNLINSGASYGVLRTENYSGVAEDDISKACFEVTREEPMGIYAVDYIAHSVNRIVSYYEIEVYVTYKRSSEEITGVVPVRSVNEAQMELREALEDGEASVSMLMLSTVADDIDAETGVENAYRSNPLLVPVCPKVQVNTYAASESSIQTIVEILLDYGYGREELAKMTSELYSYVRNTIDISNYGDVDYVCRHVMERCIPDEEAGESTAYAALIGSGVLNNEGYAMAVKLMCNSAGLDSYVVEGRKNGAAHFWNIVNMMGKYYHVDVFTSDLSGELPEFMLDEDIEGSYEWDRERYPVCGEHEDHPANN